MTAFTPTERNPTMTIADAPHFVEPADLIAAATRVVCAHLASTGGVASDELPALIRTVHDTLAGLGQPATASTPDRPEPAVSIRASVKPDHIVCLEDGRKLKMLKRHLATRYGMTPEQYRARWDLPADYPMVAPGYSAKRRELAVSSGLGHSRKVAR